MLLYKKNHLKNVNENSLELFFRKTFYIFHTHIHFASIIAFKNKAANIDINYYINLPLLLKGRLLINEQKMDTLGLTSSIKFLFLHQELKSKV